MWIQGMLASLLKNKKSPLRFLVVSSSPLKNAGLTLIPFLLFFLRRKNISHYLDMLILDHLQHVEALEVLLQGLSGVPRQRLRVHELCLKSGTNLGVVSSEVHLLCNLAQTTPSWTVRHIGGAMRGAGSEQISVMVRSVVESKVSNNVLRFFYALGYKLDHEVLKMGSTFRFVRGAEITVTVTSVNKMTKLHAIEEAVPVTPSIQMVEITAPAAADNYTKVAAAVTSLCEYLAPLLHLSKPGVPTGIVPTAASAAASLMSNSGGKALKHNLT